jgi:hypothetical protein
MARKIADLPSADTNGFTFSLLDDQTVGQPAYDASQEDEGERQTDRPAGVDVLAGEQHRSDAKNAGDEEVEAAGDRHEGQALGATRAVWKFCAPVFCRLVQVRNFEYIDCAALIEPISAMIIPYRSSSSSSIDPLCSQVLAQVAPLAGRARSSGHRRALGRGG